MLEVLAIVFLVIVAFCLIFFFIAYRDKKYVEDVERQVVSAKEKINIAQRKYMQGKIKKPVFEAILDQLEEELISAQLLLFRLKNSSTVSVKEKTLQIVAKLDKPTKYRKTKIENILKETQLIRDELAILEGKLLKREINQSVFEKLVKDKESKLIEKERELTNVVILGSDSSKFSKVVEEKN